MGYKFVSSGAMWSDASIRPAHDRRPRSRQSPPYLVCKPVSSMMRVGSPAVPVWLTTPCSC
jgi:hypothetical protein